MSKLNDAAAQASLARQTLAQFTGHGEQLTDGRHIIHYFYGDRERLSGLRAELEANGYGVREATVAAGLIAETIGVIDEAWADETMPMMCELADKFGAEYDGWEASMVRQRTPRLRNSGWLRKIFGKRS